jgi:paraquat-inducible protein B
MKRRLNPLVVGAFVLGALLLATIALLSFGARRFFSEPFRFVVLIEDSSISGLEVGSAVKLSGVRVGRVESVRARFDRDASKVLIRVECDFYEDAADSLLGSLEQTPAELMRELILGGLHAKLNFSGITGMLYMDLLMQPEAESGPAEVEYEKDTGYPIVPMAPSLLAEFTDAISKITTGLATVDYAGISTQLKTVLASVNQAVAGVELQRTTGRIESAAAAIESLAADPHLRDALEGMSEGLEELRGLVSAWREASPGLTNDFATTLDAATQALQDVSRLAQSGSGLLEERRELPDELAATLAGLQRAADAIERLADYIERNPSSLLRGRADAGPARE